VEFGKSDLGFLDFWIVGCLVCVDVWVCLFGSLGLLIVRVVFVLVML